MDSLLGDFMRILIKDIVNKESESVELLGWVACRRDHGKLIFIDLRDRTGIVQVVFLPKPEELHGKADKLRSEWVIKLTGKINKRPAGMINKDIGTGEFEICAENLEVINEAETPPFALDTDGREIGEEHRMKYRYLDLRRERMQKNIRMRSKIVNYIRNFLTEKDFVEIETPILSKSTPEGARDYIVPSRLEAGKFYALPQSPQQYKQLLMVAGFERYFQIPRCFRDEDTRGDRQPEFTQLDLEMSFPTQEEILNITEELYKGIVKTLYPNKKILLDEKGNFFRMTYAEAMEKYNSDRPDIRQDKNNPDELAFLFVTDFPMFEEKEDGSLGAVHHPFTLPCLDAKDDPYIYDHANEEGHKLREILEKKNKKELLKLKAYQYDFVLNGHEIGGGSIRTHDSKNLRLIFEALGHSEEDVKEKFGHMFEAFKYGVPPHGGIAPGIDRLVMILQNEPNIREVIAFPKTGDGRDLMMSAPSDVDEQQLKELKIKLTDNKRQTTND